MPWSGSPDRSKRELDALQLGHFNGQLTIARHQRATGANPHELHVGPVHVDIVEPFKTLRLRVDEDPAAPLALSETYTVELRPGLATADGGTFQDTWFWQFTVFGLRRLTMPKPDSAATEQPPLAPLAWSGSDATAGGVVYDLYSGRRRLGSVIGDQIDHGHVDLVPDR